MSSGGENSLSGASQPSSSVPPPPPAPEPSEGQKVGAKLHVSVTSSGAVVGKNSSRWVTRRGDFIRTHVPISIKDWRQVPQNFKDDVWNALMGEFELDVDPKLARPLVQGRWNQAFRTFKNTLRSLLKNGDGAEVEPKGIDPNIWRKFLENESDPKKKVQLKQNAENRSKLNFSHCLGRSSYAQRQHIMEQKNPGIVIKRDDAWVEARKHNNGTVLEAAKEKVEEVKAAQNKRKGKAKVGEECDDIIEDLESDVLSEVFGKETKGGIRGVGSHISKKQAIRLGVAHSKLQECKKATMDFQNSFKDAIFSHVDSRLNSVESILLSIASRLPNVSTPPLVSTPPCDIGSNSVQRPNHISQNLNNVFGTMNTSPSHIPSPIDSPRVIINNKFGKVLAKGHVVTNAMANLCHFKEVGKGEKKVYIEEVVDPDAPLWNAPQGGHHTLAGFVEGGYVIWLDMWLTYV